MPFYWTLSRSWPIELDTSRDYPFIGCLLKRWQNTHQCLLFERCASVAAAYFLFLIDLLLSTEAQLTRRLIATMSAFSVLGGWQANTPYFWAELKIIY